MAALFIIDDLVGAALRRQRVFRDRTNILEMHDDQSIIERYRLNREMILQILEAIHHDIAPVTNRSHSVPPLTQLLATLRYFAKGGFLSETADLHGISRATVSRNTGTVTAAIVNRFGGKIGFPDTEADLNKIKEGFFSISGFPNVVGAIDGTLIPILAPSLDEHAYVCRKGYHALNVQAIVDSKHRFINIVARWPGSVHDSFILTNSNIGRAFDSGRIDGWLLGDSGYPLRPWLMTPVAIPVSPGEERYNRVHKKTRAVVERAFGICKSRFRCLHKSGGHLMSQPAKCCQVIQACFILHNMCIDNNLPLLEEFPDEDTPFDYNGPVNDGITARRILIENRFN